MTIEHDEYGRVEGVERVTTLADRVWKKAGAVYYWTDGWHEVKGSDIDGTD